MRDWQCSALIQNVWAEKDGWKSFLSTFFFVFTDYRNFCPSTFFLTSLSMEEKRRIMNVCQIKSWSNISYLFPLFISDTGENVVHGSFQRMLTFSSSFRSSFSQVRDDRLEEWRMREVLIMKQIWCWSCSSSFSFSFCWWWWWRWGWLEHSVLILPINLSLS